MGEPVIGEDVDGDCVVGIFVGTLLGILDGAGVTTRVGLAVGCVD